MQDGHLPEDHQQEGGLHNHKNENFGGWEKLLTWEGGCSPTTRKTIREWRSSESLLTASSVSRGGNSLFLSNRHPQLRHQGSPFKGRDSLGELSDASQTSSRICKPIKAALATPRAAAATGTDVCFNYSECVLPLHSPKSPTPAA